MRIATLEILWLVLIAPAFKYGVPWMFTLPAPLDALLFIGLFMLFFCGVAWIWATFSDE